MSIAVAIQTYNMHKTGRAEMFERTYDSLALGKPDALNVVTNGSTDGTSDDVRRLGGLVWDKPSAMWFGMSQAINWALKQGCEYVLFSADDIEYAPGWKERLLAFWESAPGSVMLASTFWEPSWPWNAVYHADEIAGERVLFRESIPGCCWSFRARDWRNIGPIPTQSPGEDLAICQRLRRGGYDLAQLEISEHLGFEVSAWGNQSHLSAQPLDLSRWGW